MTVPMSTDEYSSLSNLSGLYFGDSKAYSMGGLILVE